MIAEFLKAAFDPHIDLNIQVWKNFEKLGEVKEFQKETILKEANTTEKYITLLINGCGGSLIWKKNNFVCVDISFEHEFLCDYMSFATQKPTPVEIRLFEDAKIFRIPYVNFQETFKAGNYGEKVTRLILESSYFAKQQQQADLLTLTAKERYLGILADKKGIDRIPLKYLASYLGITPQSLSRIRAEKIRDLPNGK